MKHGTFMPYFWHHITKTFEKTLKKPRRVWTLTKKGIRSRLEHFGLVQLRRDLCATFVNVVIPVFV